MNDDQASKESDSKDDVRSKISGQHQGSEHLLIDDITLDSDILRANELLQIFQNLNAPSTEQTNKVQPE